MSGEDRNDVSSPGGGIGGRMAKLVADATVYTRQRMGPHQNAVVQKALADFTNHVSDEIRGALGPLWQQFADSEETPSELKPLFTNLANERGQAWAWLGGAIGGTAVSSGISGILNDLLAPLTQSVLARWPNLLLSPEQAAALVVKGIWDLRTGVQEAQKSGISGERFNSLVAATEGLLASGEVIELYRRGEIDHDRARALIRRSGIDNYQVESLLKLRQVHLSPEMLAAMWNRSIVSTDEGRRIAAKSGISASDFDKMTELGGEPLSPQELGEAFRRGFIDRDRLRRGIVQGPIRNEWFDVIEKLQFHRMSPVDAADAVNQGHMSAAEGKRIAHESGLLDKDFETLLVTAGQPPGIEFAQEAWNRGLISESEFETMFLESRIKNRYLPLLKKMRTRIIPQETVRLLYRNGVYSREKTLKTLLWHGFTPDDAAALISLEDTRGDDETKQLTRSQIIDLYETRIIQESEALNMLKSLGYSDDIARAQLDLADLRRIRTYITSAIGRVRSAYLTGKMDPSAASAQLDRLGVQPDARDDMLSLWDIDRTTITQTLTPSQIRQALKKELIGYEEAISRLIARGYDETDAQIFLQLTA